MKARGIKRRAARVVASLVLSLFIFCLSGGVLALYIWDVKHMEKRRGRKLREKRERDQLLSLQGNVCVRWMYGCGWPSLAWLVP